MRVFFFWALGMLLAAGNATGQQNCYTAEYAREASKLNTGFLEKQKNLETFIREHQSVQSAERGEGAALIKIPVVVHILYNQAGENISDAQVNAQIAALNLAFRRRGADTVKTPDAFKSIAADCEIEFQLATSDPRRRSTTGIVRKYTPVVRWNADDKMKFSAETGSDAWDASQYLNIWVCNLRLISGYSSLPASDPTKDGIVLGLAYFAKENGTGFGMGKTAVHEVGHWLNLRHIWGDAFCGDDGIGDTPAQGNFTSGCPSGVRSSCGNGAAGDMYMNYMDLTMDECTNLFTKGQKEMMWTMFASGGPRQSLLYSKGLLPPLINEIPLPEETPKWLHPHLYPNPAENELVLDLTYDVRWIGKTIFITNTNGQQVMQDVISSKVHQINISRLRPGMYFLFAKKEDGVTIKQKFIKK